MIRGWKYLGTTGRVGKRQRRGEKLSYGKPRNTGAELGRVVSERLSTSGQAKASGFYPYHTEFIKDKECIIISQKKVLGTKLKRRELMLGKELPGGQGGQVTLPPHTNLWKEVSNTPLQCRRWDNRSPHVSWEVPSPHQRPELRSPYLQHRTSPPIGSVLDFSTGGHLFDPHTRHSYYYCTRIANQSPGIGTSSATEGFQPTSIELMILYR